MIAGHASGAQIYLGTKALEGAKRLECLAAEASAFARASADKSAQAGACFSTALRGTSPITVFGKRR